MATMSATIFCVSRTSDRQVKQLMTAMDAQMRQLQTSNMDLQGRVNELGDLQQRLQVSISTHQRNVRSLSEENKDLKRTTEELDEIKRQYQAQLTRAQTTADTMRDELKSLRELAGDESMKVERLKALNDEQRQRIVELSAQLENLNELQRRSTKMIQMLAMYGDDCKTLGISLKDTSATLRETDTSLGLTAEEMALQLEALRRVTEQLSNVSLERLGRDSAERTAEYDAEALDGLDVIA